MYAHCNIDAPSCQLRDKGHNALLSINDPFFINVTGQLAHEARRLHEDVHSSAIARHHWKDEIQLLLRARDGDIEETALLFFAGDHDFRCRLAGGDERLERFVELSFRHLHNSAWDAQCALRRKASVGEPDYENDPPLEALRLVRA